jgi:hypothetical protein
MASTLAVRETACNPLGTYKRATGDTWSKIAEELNRLGCSIESRSLPNIGNCHKRTSYEIGIGISLLTGKTLEQVMAHGPGRCNCPRQPVGRPREKPITRKPAAKRAA